MKTLRNIVMGMTYVIIICAVLCFTSVRRFS